MVLDFNVLARALGAIALGQVWSEPGNFGGRVLSMNREEEGCAAQLQRRLRAGGSGNAAAAGGG